MLLSKYRCLLLLLFLWSLPPGLQAQEHPGQADPVSLIGLSLDQLIRRFGAPRSVYAVRGLEHWQDDVVFVYEHGDFYIYKDRVWKAGLKAARGIRTGDTRGAVIMALGANAQVRGESLLYTLDERSWPLVLRCDFDRAGRVQAIFIYRTDF